MRTSRSRQQATRIVTEVRDGTTVKSVPRHGYTGLRLTSTFGALRDTTSTMKIPGLRSSYDMVGGVVFFGRMVDKIRVHTQGRLPADYNRGTGLDERACRFLHVDYEQLVSRVLQGGTDEEILDWCHQQGRRPSEEEIFVWNAFMMKRGWRDDISEWLAEQKQSRGWEHRDDIQTAFDFHVADETEF